ncbi:MAG TPA: DHA2 family efflux MFS transporter permease subunit [Ktedonobacterales bacterium]|nr:DHA2 family efflux MFS transporter permease subunit [Ktedonobacterales bacterium]
MRQSNRYLIALVVALGMIPGLLDSSIVIVALAPIRNALHSDTNVAQWIITAFLLASAAVVAAGGYLANRFGRKRMFLLGVTVFTLGSLLCAIAPSIGWLIASRVLQGIGGGALLPIGPALAFDAFPKEERARASAVVGIPLLLAPVFGPVVGGYLNDRFDWHSIFFVNLPVGALALVAALVVLPRDQHEGTRRARFDYLGLLLSSAGIVAIVYALNLVTQKDPGTVTAANPTGNLYGWGAAVVWLLLGGGMALLGLFAIHALWISRDPALDLRQYGRRDFLVSSLLVWVTSITSFGALVLVPLYLEAVRLPHLSALQTGLAIMPVGAGAVVGVILSTTLYRALGPRHVVLIGALLATASAWVLAQSVQPTAGAAELLAAARAHAPVPALAGPELLRWRLFFVGLSFTFIGIPVQTLALESLSGAALAKATSLFTSTKLVFSSVGVAIVTTLLIDRTASRATTLAQQLHALAPGAGTDPGDPRVAAALRALEAQMAAQAGTWAIQGIFWLMCLGSLALIPLCLLLPGYRHRSQPAPSAALPAEKEGVTVGS